MKTMGLHGRQVDEKFVSASKAFCIMPWVHFHVTQNGTVTPCCVTPWDEDKAFGNINRQTISELWNSAGIRAFRLKMLNDEQDERCWRCYKKEQAGLYSLRRATNEDYKHHLSRVNSTTSEGFVKESPVYFDIRYSNFCNFKCRICGPWSSNTWFNDARELGMGGKDMRLTESLENEEAFFADLRKYLPHAEEIYFAGGEPLMMEQHYKVLDILIEMGLTHIYLRYNSNFSLLKYKDKNILNYWKQFSNIFLCASLDDDGKRGELQRKEQSWVQTVEHRKILMQECPHIDFMLAPTVSVFNVFHLPEFHKRWTEEGLIDVSEIFPSMLEQPEHYNIQILPKDLKGRVKEIYKAHVEWMKTQASKDEFVKGVVMNEFEKCMEYMDAADLSHLLPQFKNITLRLDEIRKEQTAITLPELKPLLD